MSADPLEDPAHDLAAEEALIRAEDTTDKEAREAWALVGIGYAVLDLASAIREGREHGNAG